MEDKWIYSLTSKLWDNKSKFPDVGVVTISYEWSEKNQCKEPTGSKNPECTEHNPTWTSADYVTQTDVNFMKLGANGITVVVSSGDDGALGNFGQPA